MRGTDVTEDQLDHARQFLDLVQTPEQAVVKVGVVNREDVIRLLAWYGSIRGKGRPLIPIVVKRRKRA